MSAVTAPSSVVARRWQGDLLLLSVALGWGYGFVVVKNILRDVSPLLLLTLRFSFAALVVLPLLLRMRAEERGRSLRHGMLAGIFLAGGYILQTIGQLYTTPGNSGFITGLYIPMVPLLLAVVGRRLPPRRETLGAALALVGLLALGFPELNGNLRVNAGDALTLGCAVMFAVHLIALGHYSKRDGIYGLVSGQFLSVALLSAAGIPVERPWIHFSGKLAAVVLLLALVLTVGAFWAMTWAQSFTGSTRAALILAMEPVFAMVASVATGTESLTRGAVVGAALILAGMVVIQTGPDAV